MSFDDQLMLAEDDSEATEQESNSLRWPILIVDDEESIHQVTVLSLKDLTFLGRQLEFLHAYTGEESVQIMQQRPDVAVILMDVVMETDSAGLDAVDRIRNEQANEFVRIILRTGQPGQAPEREVITRYSINDYKEKTELTSTKLFSVIHTAIASYRDLVSLETNRRGLEKVLESSARLLNRTSLHKFAEGLLEQLVSLLYVDKEAFFLKGKGFAARAADSGDLEILAAAGHGANDRTLSEKGIELVKQEMHKHHSSSFDEGRFIYAFQTPTGVSHAIYMESDLPFSSADRNLIELFCRNAALCMENIELDEQMQHTQHELILMLSEAIERRSNEAGNHVRRVASYAALLGELVGMNEAEVEILRMAAPLHDVGKIAIPDAILNKPGRLDAEEFEVMREHADIGKDIFAVSRLPILRAASVICGQHHERWDGKGYPEQLVGDRIDIFARIVALSDVFDALSNRRCYKPAWPPEDVIKYVKEQKGKHFDPQLVDLMLSNMGRFHAIAEELRDGDDVDSVNDMSQGSTH